MYSKPVKEFPLIIHQKTYTYAHPALSESGYPLVVLGVN